MKVEWMSFYLDAHIQWRLISKMFVQKAYFKKNAELQNLNQHMFMWNLLSMNFLK